MKTLFYTVALDPGGDGLFPAMARMLYASWNHTGNASSGDFFILSDQDHSETSTPKNLRYLRVPPAAPCHVKSQAWQWLPHEEYEAIFYLDSDCLFGRKLELPSTDWRLLVQPGTGRPIIGTYYNSYLIDEEMATLGEERGLNAGTFAVRAGDFPAICKWWQDVIATLPSRPLWRPGSDQAAWNRVVLDFQKRNAVEPFAPGAIAFPFLRSSPEETSDAAILHFAAGGQPRRFPRCSTCISTALVLPRELNPKRVFKRPLPAREALCHGKLRCNPQPHSRTEQCLSLSPTLRGRVSKNPDYNQAGPPRRRGHRAARVVPPAWAGSQLCRAG
jgi:hypothetical protein